MKKLKFVYILVLSLLLISCSNNEKNDEGKIYTENMCVATCTNGPKLSYDFQLASYEKLENENIELYLNSETASVARYELNYLESLTNDIRVYSLYITLDTPASESNYDIILEFPDLNQEIKFLDNVNMNFNNADFSLSYEKNLVTSFDNTVKDQIFENTISLPDYNVNELTFDVLGEELIDTTVLDKNTVKIVSKSTTPMIIGYSFKSNEKDYCIGNTYHLSDFNEANVKLMDYFK